MDIFSLESSAIAPSTPPQLCHWYIRAKQSSFITPKLCKAIIIRSKLRNKFLKEKREVSSRAYIKQRNYYVNLFGLGKPIDSRVFVFLGPRPPKLYRYSFKE